MSLRSYEISTASVGQPKSVSPPRRIQGTFLKGPIPLDWLQQAGVLPGKALHLGVALWFRAGLAGSMTVKLANTDLAAMGVARDAKYEGLQRLKAAGLISVEQQPGRAPTVTLLLVGEAAGTPE
ncbi:hypothetical protein MCEMIEM13_02455 [Comamonadaceae bacterium]